MSRCTAFHHNFYMRVVHIIASFIAVLCVMAIIGWLIFKNIVPFGIFISHWRPGEPSALIRPLLPESRLLPVLVSPKGTPYQSIVEEPVHFDVRLPQSFDTATVRLFYAGEPNIVEIGGLASREAWAYELEPAENRLINELAWPKLTQDTLTLYQRQPKFISIAEFLTNVPASGVATYRAHVASRLRIPGYVPQTRERTFTTAFRGTTAIKAYLENEVLDFSFLIQDVNRHEGADVLTVNATLDDAAVARVVRVDDGNVGADGKLSSTLEVHVRSEKPLTGIVRLDLSAPDDIFFRETRTTQQKFVFLNAFYAADHVGYLPDPAPLELVMSGQRLTAQTAHPEAFQTISAGTLTLMVNDINRRFSVLTRSEPRVGGVTDVRAPYADVRLLAPGVFAFSRDTFFNPEAIPFTWETDVDKDGINYVLTTYRAPHQNGEFKMAEVEFAVNKLSLKNRTATFTISVPGIEYQQKELRIAGIEVVLRRPPLTRDQIIPALLKLWRTVTGGEREFINRLKN